MKSAKGKKGLLNSSPAFQVTEVQQVELPTVLDMIDVVYILINSQKDSGC